MSNEDFEKRLAFKIVLQDMIRHTWPFSRNSKSIIIDSEFTQVKLTPLKIFVMWIQLRRFKEAQ